MTHIKICGITSLQDARAAIDAGADYLGFNFYPPSPRSVEPSVCAEITSVLRQEAPQVGLVGVFVNMPTDQIKAIVAQCGLGLVQLHGDESPADVAAFDGAAFKAVRLSTDFFTDSPPKSWGRRIQTDFLQRTLSRNHGLERMRTDFKSFVDARNGQSPALLVDAAVKGAYGGTGVTADWDAAAALAQQIPLLLAGGLIPENVAEAVRRVQPWGVDTASGVESAPGKKDAEKMKRFVNEVQNLGIR